MLMNLRAFGDEQSDKDSCDTESNMVAMTTLRFATSLDVRDDCASVTISLASTSVAV
jgi:hypothetical protein